MSHVPVKSGSGQIKWICKAPHHLQCVMTPSDFSKKTTIDFQKVSTRVPESLAEAIQREINQMTFRKKFVT